MSETESRKDLLGEIGRVVVKIGSSSIMRNQTSISRDFMDSVAEQVARLKEMGIEVLIVSSGAIAIGLKAMKVKPKPNEIPIRQAASAVGQGILMKEWSECFQRHGMIVGQVLMTLDNYSDRTEAVNMNNTIESLLKNGVVPIFNENDAVCISEIKFGDNDTLSAIVASRTDADLLIILSDVAGLYNSDPTTDPDAKLVPVVYSIDDVRHMAGDSVSGVGTGGMKTKLNAAQICHDAACGMIIALSREDQVIYRATTGDDIGTIFVANKGISKKRRLDQVRAPLGKDHHRRGCPEGGPRPQVPAACGDKGCGGPFQQGGRSGDRLRRPRRRQGHHRLRLNRSQDDQGQAQRRYRVHPRLQGP